MTKSLLATSGVSVSAEARVAVDDVKRIGANLRSKDVLRGKEVESTVLTRGPRPAALEPAWSEVTRPNVRESKAQPPSLAIPCDAKGITQHPFQRAKPTSTPRSRSIWGRRSKRMIAREKASSVGQRRHSQASEHSSVMLNHVMAP